MVFQPYQNQAGGNRGSGVSIILVMLLNINIIAAGVTHRVNRSLSMNDTENMYNLSEQQTNIASVSNESYADPILNPNTEYGDVQSIPHYSSVRPYRLWPNGLIYYEFDPMVSESQRSMFGKVKQNIEDNTCLKFKKRTTESARVYIKAWRNSGCYSSTLGRSGGYQEINLEPGVFGIPQCWTFGIVSHEILHVLGLYHEQARNDRDQYIKVYYDRITCPTQYQKGNFQQKLVGTFDYGSVMMYRPSDCSIDGLPVMKAIQPPVHSNQQKMGQRSGPSEEDYRKLRIMYDCPANSIKKKPTPVAKKRPNPSPWKTTTPRPPWAPVPVRRGKENCPPLSFCGRKEGCVAKACVFLMGDCRCWHFS